MLLNKAFHVQVFPVYPFLQQSILQCRPILDMRGCPTFVLWLPRDLHAHLFWKRRDLLAPYFWDETGSPGMPPMYKTLLLNHMSCPVATSQI
jgi:hypothetical protein